MKKYYIQFFSKNNASKFVNIPNYIKERQNKICKLTNFKIKILNFKDIRKKKHVTLHDDFTFYVTLEKTLSKKTE